MEFQYLNVIVLFLLVLVTFNLFLTVKLMKAMSMQSGAGVEKETLEIGSEIVPFIAVKDIVNADVNLSDYGSAIVLVFLNSDCPSCKEKIKEVTNIIELSANESITFLLITAEPYKRFRAFLDNTALLHSLLRVDNETYDTINPLGASPAYLFVNEDNVLEAEGLIGDENWMGLVTQLTTLKEQIIDEKFNTNTA
jgi:hypothetical protein